MIAIVDYGVGNVAAISNIYKRLDIAARLVGTADDLAAADRIVLPGVGSFDWAMGRLDRSGLRPALERAVLEERKPILGICVGMQMLARGSEEGRLPGFGWIDGQVKTLRAAARRQTHAAAAHGMERRPAGRLGRSIRRSRPLMPGSTSCTPIYFEAADPVNVLAVTDYNGRFVFGVRSANIFGVQFHPEKSHQWGIKLLKNFAGL